MRLAAFRGVDLTCVSWIVAPLLSPFDLFCAACMCGQKSEFMFTD